MITLGKRYKLTENVSPDIRKLVARDVFTVTGLFCSRISDRKLFVNVAESRLHLAEDMLEPVE